MELPPLLSVKHVMFICSCSKPKAYEIMRQGHRIVWQKDKGDMLRLLRDPFLEQLANESKRVSA